MALNAFTFSGGANVSVGTTLVGVAVTGPTLNITNLSKDVTVYGSLGGSGANTLNPSAFVSGAALGAASATFPNSLGVAGFAVPPLTSLPVAVSGQAYLWLVTLAGEAGVNVANGT